jgi:hypothetical protein
MVVSDHGVAWSDAEPRHSAPWATTRGSATLPQSWEKVWDRKDMFDRDREAADLARAEADVAEGERRVSEQRLRIEHLRADGHDTALAESLLRTFESTLGEWIAHRDEIVRRIALIDAGLT